MEYVIDKTLGQVSCRQPIPSVRSGWAVLNTWYGRYSQRHALLQLDERLLADIGLTRAEAEAEAGKPFWVA